ncbi:hypothetical protein BDR22DRAFT_830936 [Usnea florida]
MGTHKGCNAKKATTTAAKKKKLSTKQDIANPIPRPRRPCRRPRFAKAWEEWEDHIVLGLHREGKTYAEITQQLSHRTYEACVRRQADLKARRWRTQEIDARISSIPKRPRKPIKRWEDWEDQILMAHLAAGGPGDKIKTLLPHRSGESICQRARRKRLSETWTPGDRQPSNATSEDIVHYGTNSNPWIQEEDQTLRSLLESGLTFHEIAESLPNRSGKACQARWDRIRQDQGPRKTNGRPWADWEERHIFSGNYAGLSWEEISKSMTGRTAKSCAARWLYLFRSTDTDEVWAAQDLALLVDLRSQGSSWEHISENFPRHSINACRSQWYKETEGIQGPLLYRRPRESWLAREVKTLVSLYNTIGARWDEICKHLPGRSALACRQHLRKCTKEDGVGEPPSEFWEEYFASKLISDTPPALKLIFCKISERLAAPVRVLKRLEVRMSQPLASGTISSAGWMQGRGSFWTFQWSSEWRADMTGDKRHQVGAQRANGKIPTASL